jgi:glucose/arabinose dehydrogenase
MDPNTGAKTTVLDLSTGSTWLPSPSDTLNAVNMASWSSWPQGGLAGLAIHPKFLDGSGLYDYVYVSYVHRLLGGSSPTGIFFRNKLVRFTYNTGTNKLESPIVLCDTLPGSSDHNSQRIIIAPVTSGGTNYLFYAQGDMGSGQFANRDRAEKAQYPQSYEGKILRFNLESDGDAGPNAWIPDNNPYNVLLGVQSAVYSIGIRNNQGFAYDTTLNILYGSSHGPYSDDEINIIESGRNYGHPLVIGFAADGNANNTKAGAAPGMNPPDAVTAGCPMITSESANAAAIGSSYKDPLFSGYPNSVAFPSISNLWNTTTGANAQWPTEAWSGLDLYTNKIVPGWKHSLVAASLKWGRLLRLKLGPTGTSTLPNNNVNDTISYFGSQNRFRDLTFSPDGKDIYVIMDNSSTTSGPGSANPIVPQCAGCVQKYTFLGYADAGGKSTIPASIDVTDGTINTCNTGTTVTIDNNNNNLWVPITGPDGNIMAEIYANGNNLGTVTSSFYKNSGSIRIKGGNHYLDRNMTITPQTQPSTSVKIRLYISKAEFDALDADPSSGVSAITDVKILKNSDACGSAIVAATTLIVPTFAEAHGAAGYMLQGNITSFSSFYFSSSNILLPLNLLTFTGTLQNDATLLEWETANEINTSQFIIERSIDGRNFARIGTVAAAAVNNGSNHNYDFTDYDATRQSSSILYYRLKMVDRDGAYTYSKVVIISLPYLTGNVSVFPNPASKEVKVTITTPVEGKAKWSLIDNTGRVVIQNSASLKKGSNILPINIGMLSAGTYYLSVSGAGIDQKVKLEKL